MGMDRGPKSHRTFEHRRKAMSPMRSLSEYPHRAELDDGTNISSARLVLRTISQHPGGTCRRREHRGGTPRLSQGTGPSGRKVNPQAIQYPFEPFEALGETPGIVRSMRSTRARNGRRGLQYHVCLEKFAAGFVQLIEGQVDIVLAQPTLDILWWRILFRRLDVPHRFAIGEPDKPGTEFTAMTQGRHSSEHHVEHAVEGLIRLARDQPLATWN
jgi:hypothetical protein